MAESRVVFQAIVYSTELQNDWWDVGLYSTLDDALVPLRNYLLAEMFHDGLFAIGRATPWGVRYSENEDFPEWMPALRWMETLTLAEVVIELSTYQQTPVAVIKRVIHSHPSELDAEDPPEFPVSEGVQRYGRRFEPWSWTEVVFQSMPE